VKRCLATGGSTEALPSHGYLLASKFWLSADMSEYVVQQETRSLLNTQRHYGKSVSEFRLTLCMIEVAAEIHASLEAESDLNQN
jgi:hypothetical protein